VAILLDKEPEVSNLPALDSVRSSYNRLGDRLWQQPMKPDLNTDLLSLRCADIVVQIIATRQFGKSIL
jgi:hypothetical protein